MFHFVQGLCQSLQQKQSGFLVNMATIHIGGLSSALARLTCPMTPCDNNDDDDYDDDDDDGADDDVKIIRRIDDSNKALFSNTS